MPQSRKVVYTFDPTRSVESQFPAIREALDAGSAVDVILPADSPSEDSSLAAEQILSMLFREIRHKRLAKSCLWQVHFRQ